MVWSVLYMIGMFSIRNKNIPLCNLCVLILKKSHCAPVNHQCPGPIGHRHEEIRPVAGAKRSSSRCREKFGYEYISVHL